MDTETPYTDKEIEQLLAVESDLLQYLAETHGDKPFHVLTSVVTTMALRLSFEMNGHNETLWRELWRDTVTHMPIPFALESDEHHNAQPAQVPDRCPTVQGG